MAAYISVPRDLTKVKSKVAFNLTKRQLVCFGTAALIGVPLFFVLRDSGGNTVATLGMMAIMDAHVADKLLRDGRVRLKDCKSAKGKTYNATVLLATEADGRSKFSLEFEGGR